MRLVICGGPRTGKTTLATLLGLAGVTRHTDDLLAAHPTRDGLARACAAWLAQDGPWVVEGTAGALGLRSWLLAHPGAPCERVVHCGTPWVERTPAQVALAHGLERVWGEVLPLLRRRGVEVVPAGRLRAGLVARSVPGGDDRP